MDKKLFRAWCFTAWTIEEVDGIVATPHKAICIYKEICPTTGKEHYQGYVRFPKPQRFSWWKNQFPNVHVEFRKGSEEQAAEYCRKNGEKIIDEGCAVEMASDGDAHERAARLIAEGAPLWQVHKEMGPKYYYLNCSRIEKYHSGVTWFRENHYDYLKDEE